MPIIHPAWPTINQRARQHLASGKRGDLEALLRREGIYSSLLSSWRTQLGAYGAAGLGTKKAGRKPRLNEAERRNIELTKRNAELERKLHIANVLIALQQKSARGPGHYTARERRRHLMDLVEDLADPSISVDSACSAVGVSRATLYRATSPT